MMAMINYVGDTFKLFTNDVTLSVSLLTNELDRGMFIQNKF